MKKLSDLWRKDDGFVLSSELLLGTTVLVTGMTVGMATVRDQVVQEMGDVAAAISDLNQSYSFSSIVGHTSSTAGSFYFDQQDHCDAVGQVRGESAACIDVHTTAAAAEQQL